MSLLTFALWFKEAPEEASQSLVLPTLITISLMAILEEALRSLYSYWCNLRADEAATELEASMRDQASSLKTLLEDKKVQPQARLSQERISKLHGSFKGSLPKQNGKSIMQRSGTRGRRYSIGIVHDVLDMFDVLPKLSFKLLLRKRLSDAMHTFTWANSQLLVPKILACGLAFVGIIPIFVGYDAEARHRLTRPPLNASSTRLATAVNPDEDDVLPILTILALALIIEMQAFFSSLVMCADSHARDAHK